MRIIERGHIYALKNHIEGEQVLAFLKSLPEDPTTHNDGVLCQEVIRALIDRMIDLNSQVPCQESTEIILKLRECLIMFETRAFRRSLEKCYSKTGFHVEQLPVKNNGHFFDPRFPSK